MFFLTDHFSGATPIGPLCNPNRLSNALSNAPCDPNRLSNALCDPTRLSNAPCYPNRLFNLCFDPVIPTVYPTPVTQTGLRRAFNFVKKEALRASSYHIGPRQGLHRASSYHVARQDLRFRKKTFSINCRAKVLQKYHL